MTTPVTFEGIDQAVEGARPTMERLASELWQLAELSLQEVQSARLIMDILREEGFTTGSVPFLIIDAARLGRHQVVHCGAEGCRTSTEEKDRKDERSF